MKTGGIPNRKVENHRRPGPVRRLAAGGLILATLGLSGGCGERNTFVPPPPPRVTVSQPVKQPVTDYLEFTGNTKAYNTVQLRARVEGYLEKLFFKDGDRVKKGQVLFLIQQDTYEAKLKQAEADILAQKARLFHAQTEYARFSKLVTQKAAAQSDMDRWLYEKDAAQAALMAAEAQLDLARLNLSYTKVAAPFDGRIGRRLKDPGNMVGVGEATVLGEVDQIDPIYVYFTINERDLLAVIKETQEAPDSISRKEVPLYLGLTDDPDYTHQGRLDFASISLNPTTGTLTLRGVFPNPGGKILPGLFGRIKAPAKYDQAALLIPQVAIGYDQLGPYVLVVDDQKVVQRRGVKQGVPVKDLVVIQEGLTVEDWVITNGLLSAIPGKQVTPVKEAVPKAEESAAPPGGQLKKAVP